MSELIKAPNCITPDGRHEIDESVDPDDVFVGQCKHCFERFVLVSETILKEMEIEVTERKLKGDGSG